MGRSALHGGIVISSLICTSELARADGMMNVESLCAGAGLKSGVWGLWEAGVRRRGSELVVQMVWFCAAECDNWRSDFWGGLEQMFKAIYRRN